MIERLRDFQAEPGGTAGVAVQQPNQRLWNAVASQERLPIELDEVAADRALAVAGSTRDNDVTAILCNSQAAPKDLLTPPHEGAQS